MTVTLEAPNERVIIYRALCSIALVLSGFLAGCGTTHHNMEATPTVESLPEAKRIPLHAGIYYSPQFASYIQQRRKGSGVFRMHIGAASVRYFDQLLPRMFEKTSRVETLASDELEKKGVDFVVAPSLEHFDFPLGLEPYSERLGVAYRTTLFTPRGVPVSSWVVYGTADHWKMFGGVIEAYIQQAGAKFVQTFDKEAAPGLAAVASSRRRVPQPIDIAALQLSARHAEPASLPANAREQLLKERFVFVEVSAAAKTSTPIAVRASDMRLRLKDGRMIGTSPPSALLSIAAAGGPNAASVVGVPPLLGVVALLASETVASSASASRRELLSNALGVEFFGERMLREDNAKAAGIVFFRLPAGASADGATVIAWAVEPATAAGSEVEMPLLGAPTRSAVASERPGTKASAPR